MIIERYDRAAVVAEEDKRVDPVVTVRWPIFPDGFDDQSACIVVSVEDWQLIATALRAAREVCADVPMWTGRVDRGPRSANTKGEHYVYRRGPFLDPLRSALARIFG